MSDIGVNLGGVSYWSTEYVFLDRMKTMTSAGWFTRAADGTVVHPALDERGNPTAIPNGATTLIGSVQMDPVSLPMPDRYVLLYDGKGTVTLQNATIVEQSDGRIVFDYRGKPGATLSDSMVITIRAIDSSDPLRDLHLVRADQMDLYEAGEIFNPAFLEDVGTWGAVRFMDWGLTNGSQVVHWDERTPEDYASYGKAGAAEGVPIEVMVQLANQTGTDMWYNIPAHADDDYVRNAVQYIKDHLDPSLKLYLEYSNEVWNWGFEQARYSQNQADLLWGNDANHDGQYSGSEAVGAGNLVYYGYRSAQVAAIAKSVYGAEADARLADVLSSQTSYRGAERYVLDGVARADLGGVAQLFDSWAITGYFGNALSTAARKPDAAATVLEWAQSGAAGLDAAFHELEFGGSVVTDSLANLAELYAYWDKVAAQYGLTLDAYEAGAHLVSQPYGANQKLIEDFFSRLINDPRMGELYAKNVEAFAAAGGDLFNQYVGVAPSGQYGYWGTIDGTYADPTDRWNAYVAARTKCRGAPLPRAR
jgi:hypothetical protein